VGDSSGMQYIADGRKTQYEEVRGREIHG
jgi:hypothetical protein